LQGFPLSEPPFDVLLIGFPHLKTQILAYGIFTFDPRADEP